MSIVVLARKHRALKAKSTTNPAWKTTNSSTRTGRIMRCCAPVVHDPKSSATGCGSHTGANYPQYDVYMEEKVESSILCDEESKAAAKEEAEVTGVTDPAVCTTRLVGGRAVPYSNTVKRLDRVAVSYDEYITAKKRHTAC